MSATDNNQHPKQDAESKAHRQESADNWGKVFQRYFHSVKDSWIPNLVVGLALLLIGPISAFIMNTKATAVWGTALGLTVLVWTAAITLVKQIDHSSPPIAPLTPEPVAIAASAPAAPTPLTIEQQADYQSHLAAGRKWSPPPVPAAFFASGRQVAVRLGGLVTRWPANVSRNAPDAPAPIIMPGGRIVVPYVEGHRVYIKTQTMFGDEEKPLSINNEWPTKLPVGGDVNFNATDFEIVDHERLPILQVRYLAPDSIEVNGIFISEDGAKTVAFGDFLQSVQRRERLPEIPSRRAWFKYPSTRFPGQLEPVEKPK